MKDHYVMLNPFGEAKVYEDNINRPLLGRLGQLSTRLAQNHHEIREAQRIRHNVFCKEFGATPQAIGAMQDAEADGHDINCDHLLVQDDANPTARSIVGTQRFYLRGPGHAGGKFYSQNEFDVEALLARYPDCVFMELGRSCILPEYRSKRTMELMWQGTWAYAVQNLVNVMIGCASFHAAQVAEISEELEFLASTAGVCDGWEVPAIAGNAISIDATEFDMHDGRRILRKLPPLVKGYLRLGAMFSRQAVPDPEFRTIDVLVILPVERISERYLKYYGEDASKHRA